MTKPKVREVEAALLEAGWSKHRNRRGILIEGWYIYPRQVDQYSLILVYWAVDQTREARMLRLMQYAASLTKAGFACAEPNEARLSVLIYNKVTTTAERS